MTPLATSAPAKRLAPQPRAMATRAETAYPVLPVFLSPKIICVAYLVPMVPAAAPRASLSNSLEENPPIDGLRRLPWRREVRRFRNGLRLLRFLAECDLRRRELRRCLRLGFV